MKLSALIRKRDTGSIATAIPAISATQPKGEAATVARIATVAVANPKEEAATIARIATVAVANPREEKTAPPEKVDADVTARFWAWKVTRANGAPQSHSVVPVMTTSEALEHFGDAVSIEPIVDLGIQNPKPPLQPAVEVRIRRWLASIGETDETIIEDVLSRCQRDPDALARYLKMDSALRRSA
jgi:hypothetical protein